MPELSIQDLESCNELITDLITLRLVLKDTEKTKKALKLKLKELEQEKINELKLLEEEIYFMVLRSKYLGRSDYFIKEEEEIDLRMRTKKEGR